MDQEAAKWIGRTLQGRYHIEQLLGVGGMGAVYIAEHLALRKQVALKLIRPEFSKNAEVIARFEREAMATAKVENPHVASALDYGILPDGHAFLVTQLVRGQSLRKFMEESGPLDYGIACEIAAQIADALAAAHAQGIVHRDLKPENILLEERDGRPIWVKVLDFGIARLIDDSDPKEAESRSLTRTGTVIGTPGYMPPEQAMGEAVDERADLYALGVILWEMIGGTPLFEEDDLSKLFARQLTQPVPRLRSVAKGQLVPIGLDQLTATLLDQDKGGRPKDASRVRDTLQTFTSTFAAAPTSALPSFGEATQQLGRVTWVTVQKTIRNVTERKRRNFPLLVLLGGGGVLILVAAATALWGGKNRDSVPESDSPSKSNTAATTPTSPAPPRVMSPELLVHIDTLLTAPSAEVRRHAAAKVLQAESTSTMPEFVRLVAELEAAKGCVKKRGVLIKIRQLGDTRILPTLERLHRNRKGCGFLGMNDCYGCLRRVLTQTLRDLQSTQEPAPSNSN